MTKRKSQKVTPKKRAWAPVPEWEGVYEVSTDGAVRNCKTGHLLTPQFARGYYYVHLNEAGRKRRAMSVHRLVARAFISDQADMHVNHKDLDKFNNNVDNLEWVTPMRNCHHALAHGRNDSRGSRNKMARLTEDAARVIANSTVRLSVLAYMFDTSNATCSRIRSGRTWMHATGRGRSLTTDLQREVLFG